MKNKLFTSEKNIMKIRDFLSLYVGVDYSWNEKLTHKNVNEFLVSKKKKKLISRKISTVSKENLLKGSVILVKDENCKIMAYYNPAYVDYIKLAKSIDDGISIGGTKEELEKIREEIIKNCSYEEYENQREERERLNAQKYKQKKLAKINR